MNNKYCNYQFNLGKDVFLIFRMIVYTSSGNCKGTHHHCYSWDTDAQDDQTIFIANEVKIEGRYGREIKIFVKDPMERTINPYFSRKGFDFKKFSINDEDLSVIVIYPDSTQETFVALHRLQDGKFFFYVKAPERFQAHGSSAMLLR